MLDQRQVKIVDCLFMQVVYINCIATTFKKVTEIIKPLQYDNIYTCIYEIYTCIHMTVIQ